jgi:hypothetical protein
MIAVTPDRTAAGLDIRAAKRFLARLAQAGVDLGPDQTAALRGVARASLRRVHRVSLLWDFTRIPNHDVPSRIVVLGYKLMELRGRANLGRL